MTMIEDAVRFGVPLYTEDVLCTCTAVNHLVKTFV